MLLADVDVHMSMDGPVPTHYTQGRQFGVEKKDIFKAKNIWINKGIDSFGFLLFSLKIV